MAGAIAGGAPRHRARPGERQGPGTVPVHYRFV